jgi:hypothetical protein
MSRKNVLSITPVYVTSYCDNSFARSGSTRVVTNRVRLSGRGFLYDPWMTLFEIAISLIWPALSSFSNSLYATG